MNKINSADLNGAVLAGNFTVNNNTASITFNVKADLLTEGAEQITMTSQGQTVNVTVNDTSTTPSTPPPLVQNGWLFFADMNWLGNVNTSANIIAIRQLFDKFFGGVKTIACPTIVSNLSTPYEEANVICSPYYTGAPGIKSKYLPVMHGALDPLGYTFTPVDITVPNAGSTVNKPFFMPLYSHLSYTYGTRIGYTEVFNSTVINNLRQIAANNPVMVVGEWSAWQMYDNFVLQTVMKYPEIFYCLSNSNGDGVPVISHPLGLALRDSGVTLFDYHATGEFCGGDQYAFAKTNNNRYACMLQLPYRP